MRPYIILLFAAVAAWAGCTANSDQRAGSGKNNATHAADTLYTEERAMAIYGNDLQQALLVIDSAKIVGNLTAERADLLRAMAYSRTFDTPRHDSAIVIAERLLDSETAMVNPAFRQNVLEVLVYSTRQLEDYELQLVYSTQLADAYRRQDDDVEALRTEAEVGAVLYRLGKTDEGLSKMDSVIHRLTPVRQFNELDASIIALKRKIGVVRDYPQIAAAAQQMLDRLKDYEQHPDDFRDGSPREPSDEERDGYIAFYRAQAWAYLAAAHAHLGAPQKAREYLAQTEQTDFGQTLAGKKMLAPTLSVLGEYDKMEAIYRELETAFTENGDTLTLDYAQLLLDRAKAAERQGRMSQSTALWEQHARILQKAEERLLRSKANLYAARYHAQEQQMAIERQQADLARKNLISIVLAAGLLALAVALFYVLRQQRILRRKNTVLAQEIYKATHSAAADHDVVRHDDRLTADRKTDNATPTDAALVNETSATHSEATEPASQDGDEAPLEPKATDGETLTDEQLFRYISKVIMRDELFLDPTLDRQALCARFSLTKEQLGSAFAKGSPYNSLTQFLNDLRLSVAAKLLVERPDLSVAEIARASGFARADTLTSNFKQRYTLTPSQYRAQQS